MYSIQHKGQTRTTYLISGLKTHHSGVQEQVIQVVEEEDVEGESACSTTAFTLIFRSSAPCPPHTQPVSCDLMVPCAYNECLCFTEAEAALEIITSKHVYR